MRTLRLPTLKAPTAEALALASAASLLLDVLFAGLLLLAVIDRTAPPQDLFWKPFSLDEPIGLATGRKVARIAGDPAACRRALDEGGVAFTDMPERRDGFCSTIDAGRLGGRMSRLSPAGPVMTCREALAFALFDRQVLRPAAHEILGSELAGIQHYGTYSCRRIYGQRTGRVSEHAHANAFDLAGVTLADGRRLTVAAHFNGEDARGAFWRRVRDGACRSFQVVLSPDYNAAHRDHLHLDMGPYRICS